MISHQLAKFKAFKTIVSSILKASLFVELNIKTNLIGDQKMFPLLFRSLNILLLISLLEQTS